MKRENKAKFFIHTFLFVISCSHTACSQYVNTTGKNAQPVVISDISVYNTIIKHHPEKKLVLLNNYVDRLVTDFKYMTPDNFTHQVLYTDPEAYVRLPVAIALRKVQQELLTNGMGLKVFDAYRPYSVTKKMWKVVPDERYAANPSKGSGHNRGAAVDVTLVKISTGKELPMPTDFDDFSEKAHHSYTNLPRNILENRALLKTTMEKHGFAALSTEWWHYSLSNASTHFELLDLSFRQLKKLRNGR